MSDHLPETTSQSRRRPTPARRVSAVAVCAIITASLPCPPLSLLGAVLGLMALRRIRDSGGLLYGATLARVAVIVGLLVSVLGAYLTVVFQDEMEDWQRRSITAAVHGFLSQSMNGNATGAMTMWDHAEAPVTVEAVHAFGRRLEETRGRMISVQVGTVAPMPGGSLLQPPLDAWLILEFETGRMNGNARLKIEKSGLLQLRARLQQIIIAGGSPDSLWLPPDLNPDDLVDPESESP